MKAKFFLTGKALCLRISYNNKVCNLGMSEKINPVTFDDVEQVIRKTEPRHGELNRKMKRAILFVEDFITKYQDKNGNALPPRDVLKEAFKVEFLNKPNRTEKAEPEPQPDKVNFFTFADMYMQNANLSKYRHGLFLRTIQNVKDYFTAKTINPDFNAISLQVCEGFKKFLFDVKKFNPNTTGTRIKVFKQILTAATESGYNTNLQFMSRKFTAPTNEADKIYLTEPELEQIINLDLTGKPYLNNARNLFLIGCYTGLRFSDFSLLKPENIYTTVTGKELIKITLQKTSRKIEIPLHPTVKQLLSINNGKPPRPISNQKLNEYIKEVCKLAGIVEATPVTIYKAQIKTDVTRPKFELVGTHTARRSFASNGYLSGLPLELISKILGHSTIQQTLIYLKLDAHTHAVKAAENAFFNPSKMQIAK